MCIDHDSPLCIFVALIRTPNLRKAEEEPLLRREAVDFFCAASGFCASAFCNAMQAILAPLDLRITQRH